METACLIRIIAPVLSTSAQKALPQILVLSLDYFVRI